MKRIAFFLFALVAMASAAKADDSAAYKLNVHNFCELTVIDGIGVDYICNPDSAGWAVFICEPHMASNIMFSNTEEHLTIRTAAEESAIKGLPRVRVYSASLRKIENSGDSLVRAELSVPVHAFKAKQIGNGRLEVKGLDTGNLDAGITTGCGELVVVGKARKAKLHNVSTGPIDASALMCDNVNCFIFGTGDVDCLVRESLRVFGAGSGKVRYHRSEPGKITNRGIGVKVVASEDSTPKTAEPEA